MAYGDDDDDSSSSDEEEEGKVDPLVAVVSAAPAAASSAPAATTRRSRFTALDPQVEAPLLAYAHAHAHGASSASVVAASTPAPAPAAAPVPVRPVAVPAAVEEVMDKLLLHALKAASAPRIAADTSAGSSSGPCSTSEAFVQLLLQKERSNPRFAFLQPWSPYHTAWLSKLHAAIPPSPSPPVAASPAALPASRGEGQDAVSVMKDTSDEEMQSVPGPGPGPGLGPSPPLASAPVGEPRAPPGRKQAVPPWQKAAIARGYYLDEDSDGDLDEESGREGEPEGEDLHAWQGEPEEEGAEGDSDMDVT